MKNILFFLLPLVLILSSCTDDNGPTTPEETTGYIYVTSTPSGAAIYLDGVNTNRTTPDTVAATQGVHTLTLKLLGYTDNAFDLSVESGQTSVVGPISMTALGSISLTSEPSGATIILDGVNTGFGTPTDIRSLDSGDHQITLQLQNFRDTTFTVSVTNGVQSNVNIILSPVLINYGPIRLWETVGTTAEQPSGLDLSEGDAYGISTDGRVNVDIYYSSTGFLVQSAHLHSNMTRQTWFNVGRGSMLDDGVDSDENTASWGHSMADTEGLYYFLFDDDGNYSKLKVSNRGGGVPGEPAWVELEWIYNTAEDNRLF